MEKVVIGGCRAGVSASLNDCYLVVGKRTFRATGQLDKHKAVTYRSVGPIPPNDKIGRLDFAVA